MQSRTSIRSQGQFADNTALAAIIVVLDMLSVQLVDIAKDVETSVNGVCSGFTGMSQRAREALGHASDALKNDSDGGGLQSFLHRVQIALKVLLRRIESSHDFAVNLANDIDDIDERMEMMLAFADKLDSLASDAKDASQSRAMKVGNEQELEETVDGLRVQLSVLGYATGGTSNALRGFINGLKTSISNASNRATKKASEDAEAKENGERTVGGILDQLSSSHGKMSDSLSDLATMTRQLNMDIGQAVMSMQFQDRVNQRIEHLLATIADLASELKPFTSNASTPKVQSITEFWTQRMSERSTMNAERNQVAAVQSEAADNSIELF